MPCACRELSNSGVKCNPAVGAAAARVGWHIRFGSDLGRRHIHRMNLVEIYGGSSGSPYLSSRSKIGCSLSN